MKKMDKVLFVLSLVQLSIHLVQSQPEEQDVDPDMVQHKHETVIVPSLLPQLFFEIRLLKNELHAVRSDVDKLLGIEDQVNSLSLKVDSIREECNSGKTDKATISEVKTSDNTDTAIQELKEEIDFLWKGIENEKYFVRKVESVVTDINTSLAQNLQSLDRQFTSMQERYEKTEKDILANTKEIEEWQVVTDELIKTDANTEKTLINLDSNLNSLTEETIRIDSSVGQLSSKLKERTVAFSARLSESTSELKLGTTVIFDTIVYQIGGGYNSDTGIFTCPQTGVYMFSVVILKSSYPDLNPKTLTARLMVDSSWKAVLISEAQQVGQDDQGSNFVIVSVNQGEKVWVETFYHDKVKVYRQYSTFSGALLYN